MNVSIQEVIHLGMHRLTKARLPIEQVRCVEGLIQSNTPTRASPEY